MLKEALFLALQYQLSTSLDLTAFCPMRFVILRSRSVLYSWSFQSVEGSVSVKEMGHLQVESGMVELTALRLAFSGEKRYCFFFFNLGRSFRSGDGTACVNEMDITRWKLGD